MSRPKECESTSQQISIYLPIDMCEGLRRLAKQDDRSLSYMIRLAISEYLDKIIGWGTETVGKDG